MSSNSTEASYFLIPATSGLCIQPQDGSIQTSHLNGEQSQQWFIEHPTNSDGKIAFKNAESGEYLRATNGRVTVGEKHFWSIHLSTNTPNAFRIQFDSRQFLCNMYGKFTVENLIHLVLDSTHDLQPTLWYICEFNSWKNSENWPITKPKSSSSSPSSSERDDATAKKDLSLKQDQQLTQREKTLAFKEKNLAQKENLLQQKLLRAELREREALEFEQEAKIKLEEVDEKEQELEAEKLALKKNKYKGTTSSIPTHDAENADDENENPTNENNDDNNQWLLRFSNLQKRLETAYREIEGLRRPVSPATTKTTTSTTTTATANGDNDNNDNDNDNDTDNDNDDDSNEKSSSIITSLQHELKLAKENAQKQKEENIFLWEKLKNFAFEEQNLSSERNMSSERNVSFLRRRGIRDDLVDNFDVDVEEEAASVGNRWAPLNFRVERMRRIGEEGMGSATTGRREGEEEEGIVGMIEMQKEFKFLERLR